MLAQGARGLFALGFQATRCAIGRRSTFSASALSLSRRESMKTRSIASLALSSALCACSGGVQPFTGSAVPRGGDTATAAKASHFVYWPLYDSCSFPQIQFARVPLKKKSTSQDLDCSSGNGLGYSSGLHVDSSGRLWVLYFGKYGGNPGSAAVFKLPLTASSTPEYTFVLS